LNPGDEIHWCRYFARRGGRRAEAEHAYTPGSHHVLAHTTAFTCRERADHGGLLGENGATEQFTGTPTRAP
jgi:hypothetical protein